MAAMKRLAIRIAAVLVVLAVLYLGMSWYIVGQSLQAEVSPIEERPEEYGLAYEEVAFSPRGWPEITLRGWWLPADEPKGVVVRVHGVDTNRANRLGFVAGLVEGGYSVLTFDLRGHGESDLAAMGAGIHEKDDVLAAIDVALDKAGTPEGPVFLHGISFGAAIAILVGVEDERVAGIFSDSSFASLTDLTAQEVANRTPLPQWGAQLLTPGILWVAQTTRGIDLDAVNPESVIGQYDYMVGFAHCRADERVRIEHLARLRIALSNPPWLTVYEDCTHARGWDDYPDHYVPFVVTYYDELLGIPE